MIEVSAYVFVHLSVELGGAGACLGQDLHEHGHVVRRQEPQPACAHQLSLEGGLQLRQLVHYATRAISAEYANECIFVKEWQVLLHVFLALQQHVLQEHLFPNLALHVVLPYLAEKYLKNFNIHTLWCYS